MVALSVERKACDREIACVQLLASAWWWHYTKHQGAPGAPGQMTWLKDPPPWLRPIPSPAYYLASVILWTENKNVTISGRFICFILTVKWRWWPVLWGRQLKKCRKLFWGKKCIRVTWLEDFLTSKRPGSFTALAPSLLLVRHAAQYNWTSYSHPSGLICCWPKCGDVLRLGR